MPIGKNIGVYANGALLGAGMVRRGGAAVHAITYLLRDQFLTDDAAPMTTPRTCEPGPGTLTIADAGNVMSAANDKLLISGTASGNTGLFGGSMARAAGRALSYHYSSIQNSGIGRIGWTSAFGSTILAGVYLSNAANLNIPGGSLIAYAIGPITIVLRATGYFVINGSSLLWVSHAGTNTPMGANIWVGGGQAPNLSIDEILITDIVAMDADSKIYTSYVATPTSGATATSTADAIIEFLWTPASSETLELSFRRTDDDNRYVLRCAQAAGTSRLFRRQAGAETETTGGITSQTWTAGTPYRISITTTGSAIRVYVNSIVLNIPAAQTFNQTATGVQVAGFATGADLYCWPRDVSGLLPAALRPTWPIHNVTAIGDSKTANSSWMIHFLPLVSGSANGLWAQSPTMMAAAGRSVRVQQTLIDAELAARSATPEVLLFNLGANDVAGDSSDVLRDGTGALWAADLAYVLDAVHAKWADCQIWLMRPGRRGDATMQGKLDLIGDTLIPAAIIGRDYCHLGPDERVFLEGGDDYTTYTGDGLHPNDAGLRETARQWATVLGLL